MTVFPPSSDCRCLADVPSDELSLAADVLVVIRALRNVRDAQNKVLKRLCLVTKEVQEVAEAAVLRDHKHWA